MRPTCEDYYDHPVFDPARLHILTPPMERLSEDIHRWLWTGSTGGVILGKSRSGKTRAVLSKLSSIVTRGNIKVPVYYLSVAERDHPTILSILRQVCRSVNIRQNSRDRADHLAERFVHFVADRAVETHCNHAVLIVDEMQRLWPKQFNAFADIHDNLLLMGISLMVVFVGNDQECGALAETIASDRYTHIRGRFFNQGAYFRGLTSKVEVHRCLIQYDQLRYPDDGPTYTEYFLSEAIKQGWKLSTVSEDLWRIFRDYQRQYKIDSWGMQYFLVTVNTLLTDFLPTHGVEHINDDMIHESVRVSGLIPSLIKPFK